MDDKWIELVLQQLSNLDTTIRDFQKEIKLNISDIYHEINKSKEDIKTVCINLEEIKRVNDKLYSFNEKLNDFKNDINGDIEEYKSIRKYITKNVSNIKQEITALKVKSSIWGSISGAIVSVGAAIVYLLTK